MGYSANVALFLFTLQTWFGGIGFLGSSAGCILIIIILDEYLRFLHHFRDRTIYLNSICKINLTFSDDIFEAKIVLSYNLHKMSQCWLKIKTCSIKYSQINNIHIFIFGHGQYTYYFKYDYSNRLQLLYVNTISKMIVIFENYIFDNRNSA
jgi:hypothetical protein